MTFKTYNKKATLILIILTIAITFGCNRSDNKDDSDVINGSNDKSIIIANDSSLEDFVIDPFRLVDAYLEEDVIYFQVEYSGGCKEHKFELVAFNHFLESNPVQADVLLTHNANDDTCEALKNEALEFNLAPLKEEYKESYQTDTGDIILKIHVSTNDNEYQILKYRIYMDTGLVPSSKIESMQIIQDNGNVLSGEDRYVEFNYDRNDLSPDILQALDEISTTRENSYCSNDGITYEVNITDSSGVISTYVSNNRDCGREEEIIFISVVDIEEILSLLE